MKELYNKLGGTPWFDKFSFGIAALTTQTECFETKPGRAGSQSLHSTTGSSNELTFGKI